MSVSERYTVRVLDRALDALEILRDAGGPLSLQQLTARLHLAKSSVFRLLSTLERRGYVERSDGDRRYNLGPNWLSYRDLGKHAPLTEVAVPHMRRLLETFGETVNLGILRESEVLYLEMLESPHSFRMAAAVGMRSPAHSTALGKAILAFLPETEVEAILRRRELRSMTSKTITSITALKRDLARTRTRGYSEDNGENEPEASCLGAPIFGPGGEVIGALSLSGPTSRVRPIKRAAGPALVAACQTISRAIGSTAERRARKGG